MSDRPTVSLRLCDQIIECYYMRNWPIDSLMLKCIDLIEMIGDASTRDEVRLRLGESLNPSCSESDLLSLEESSEFPVVIDLSRRLIYLKDEYEGGHPNSIDDVISSADEYERLCMMGNVFPINQAISFEMLGYIKDKLGPTTEDGLAISRKRNEFNCNVLPKLVDKALVNLDA